MSNQSPVQIVKASHRLKMKKPGDPCDNSIAQEVVLAAGEVIEDALVIDTGDDGSYPNNACQDWNIMAHENQVYVFVSNKITLPCCNLDILHIIVVCCAA